MSIQLQIENTSTCNASCVFCPYPTSNRWGGLMSMSLYHKILDEAATIPLITEVCITGLGEPTLDPYLVKRIRYTRSSKPRAIISVYTNGVYLNPGLFDEVRSAGVSFVVFSLNASDAAQHEAQMGLKDKYDLVCSNIDYAIRNRKMSRIEVRAVSTGWLPEQSDKFYGRWGHRYNGGYGQLVHEGNWAGDNRTTHHTFSPNQSCGRALSHIYVLWDGRVSTCCFDPSGNQVFGNLTKQTIREVYGSPEYLSFREAHFRDEADKYDICKNCTRI